MIPCLDPDKGITWIGTDGHIRAREMIRDYSSHTRIGSIFSHGDRLYMLNITDVCTLHICEGTIIVPDNCLTPISVEQTHNGVIARIVRRSPSHVKNIIIVTVYDDGSHTIDYMPGPASMYDIRTDKYHNVDDTVTQLGARGFAVDNHPAIYYAGRNIYANDVSDIRSGHVICYAYGTILLYRIDTGTLVCMFKVGYYVANQKFVSDNVIWALCMDTNYKYIHIMVNTVDGTVYHMPV